MKLNRYIRNVAMTVGLAASTMGCTLSQLNSTAQIPGVNTNNGESRSVSLENIAESARRGWLDSDLSIIKDSKKAEELSGHYEIKDGVLIIDMPFLNEVTSAYGVDISRGNFEGFSVGDGINITFRNLPENNPERNIKQIIASDYHIDTPFGDVDLINHTRTSLDRELEARVKDVDVSEITPKDSSVLVTMYNPYEYTDYTPFYGALRFSDNVSGIHGAVLLPMTLQNLVMQTGLGQNTNYCFVTIPRGNNKNINSVLAVSDIQQLEMGNAKYDLFLGHRWNVIAPSTDSLWEDTRQGLSQMGGILSDAVGVTDNMMRLNTSVDLIQNDELYLPSKQVGQ